MAAMRPRRTNPSRRRAASVPREFRNLRAEEILELNYGTYRASQMALYSSFRRAESPARTTDIRVSRSTAIA